MKLAFMISFFVISLQCYSSEQCPKPNTPLVIMHNDLLSKFISDFVNYATLDTRCYSSNSYFEIFTSPQENIIFIYISLSQGPVVPSENEIGAFYHKGHLVYVSGYIDERLLSISDEKIHVRHLLIDAPVNEFDGVFQDERLPFVVYSFDGQSLNYITDQECMIEN